MNGPTSTIVYKNFAAWQGISHIGLGVSAALNVSVLSNSVGPASVVPAQNNVDIVDAIRKYNSENTQPISTVVISAPWISIRDLRAMALHFNSIQFAVLSHSNVGFLQADPNGIRLLREGLALSQELPNFTIAGNAKKFVQWMEVAYGIPVILLPNMYPVISVPKEPNTDQPLKIGIFGAIRPQKNVLTAAAAAVAIARETQRKVEIWINSGRIEGGIGTLLNAMNQLVANVPNVQLGQLPWRSWLAFKKAVADMDLLLQVSYTESFNMVTADGISVGVPSVVSQAIDWAPEEWKANNDDALDIARVGVKLLQDEHACEAGVKALTKHNEKSLKLWKHYVTRESSKTVAELTKELGF